MNHRYTYLHCTMSLDDDLASVMSITLGNSPFYYYDDDPIMIGKSECLISFILAHISNIYTTII